MPATAPATSRSSAAAAPPPGPRRPAQGTPSGRALTDPFDPATTLCAITKHGKPVDGLGVADEPSG